MIAKIKRTVISQRDWLGEVLLKISKYILFGNNIEKVFIFVLGKNSPISI